MLMINDRQQHQQLEAAVMLRVDSDADIYTAVQKKPEPYYIFK